MNTSGEAADQIVRMSLEAGEAALGYFQKFDSRAFLSRICQ
ncbi:MAG: hypothetical protein V8T22_09455 [Oscillospiraceae bacterium]